MKKIMAILVLALFLVSMIPAALAEDTDSDEGLEDTSETEDAPERERIKQAKELRDELKEKAENARDNVAANRERLVEAKEELLQKHQERVQMLVDKCKETGRTEEECNGLFEKRLANIAELAPKFREKLLEFEQRREERGKELKGLEDDEVLGKIARAKDFKARGVEQPMLVDARERFEKAKEKFDEAKDKFEKAKERFENAKAARVCKDDPESEDCANARTELRAASKEKLSNQAGVIIGNLEKAKEKAESSEYLTEDEAAKAIEFIDAQIEKFNAIKAEIDAAETKEDIIAAAKKLAEAWKEVKHKVNAYINFIANARMAGVVVKAEHLSAKLERVLERMAEDGKDTSAVEPLVEEFKSELDLSKEKFKAAHSLMLEIRTKELAEEEKAGKVQEAQALLKEAKDALQEANKLLRDIFLKLKEANAVDELEEATEAEDVETEEELESAEDDEEETESEDDEDAEDETEETEDSA